MINGDFVTILEETNTNEVATEILHVIESNKHTSNGFSIFMKFAHNKTKNRAYFARGPNSLVKFCEIMKKHF